MLCLILKKVNTTTQVGMSNLKDVIEKATLRKIINSVVVMFDMMHQNLEYIQYHGSTHNDYLRHMFHTLMASNNVIFRDFIQR